MREGQSRARGLGRPLSDVLAAIAEQASAADAPVLSVVEDDDALPPALRDTTALVVTADPGVVAGWTSGADIGIAGEVDGRRDAVWTLVDDLVAVRDGSRPVVATEDGRWHTFVVGIGDRAAIGVVAPAGALAGDTCALLHALAANLRRRVR